MTAETYPDPAPLEANTGGLAVERGADISLSGYRFLHDQVVGIGRVQYNLVQNLVQLRAEEAPIVPLGSSLLR